MLLAELYREYLQSFKGYETVMGEGPAKAALMLVGEAPGKDEVKASRPFVGAAGRNLDKYLDLLGIKRERVYITNAIKYRLSEVNPVSGRIRNRPAAWGEIEQNRRFLIREIGLINPEIVVTLGNVPLWAILGDKRRTVGEEHGILRLMSLPGIPDIKETAVFPLYHPASLIYNRSLEQVFYNDVEKLKKILASKNIL